MTMVKKNLILFPAATLLAAMLVVFATWRPESAEAQGRYNSTVNSVNPNTNFPHLTFTATSQTQKTALAGFSTATVRYAGTQGGVTTATFEIEASNDGGQSYFPIPTSTGVYSSNVLNVITGASITQSAATPVMYWVNLAGMTNLEIVTSGTFTSANGSSTTSLPIQLGPLTLTTGTGL